MRRSTLSTIFIFLGVYTSKIIDQGTAAAILEFLHNSAAEFPRYIHRRLYSSDAVFIGQCTYEAKHFRHDYYNKQWNQ